MLARREGTYALITSAEPKEPSGEGVNNHPDCPRRFSHNRWIIQYAFHILSLCLLGVIGVQSSMIASLRRETNTEVAGLLGDICFESIHGLCDADLIFAKSSRWWCEQDLAI